MLDTTHSAIQRSTATQGKAPHRTPPKRRCAELLGSIYLGISELGACIVIQRRSLVRTYVPGVVVPVRDIEL